MCLFYPFCVVHDVNDTSFAIASMASMCLFDALFNVMAQRRDINNVD
jgi:hypothetical protein